MLALVIMRDLLGCGARGEVLCRDRVTMLRGSAKRRCLLNTRYGSRLSRLLDQQ